MSFNIVFNKRTFLNTPPPFNGERFQLRKARFKIFIQSINLGLWEKIINIPFIPTNYINGEVVDKPDFLWTKDEKRKFKIDFNTKNILVMSLNENRFFMYLSVILPRKCGTLLKRYMEYFQVSNKREWTHEAKKNFFPKCFSNFRNLGIYVRTFIANKYIRIKNWN